MMRKSQYGMLRNGTFVRKKDTLFWTAIVRVSGDTRPVDGVTTTLYEPSWRPAGTLMPAMKKPSVPDIVVFEARTAAPDRSSTFWFDVGDTIATNPDGGGCTFRVMLTKLLLSCATPPSLIVLSGSTMSSRVCVPRVARPVMLTDWFTNATIVRPLTRPTSFARLPFRYAATSTLFAVVCPWL